MGAKNLYVAKLVAQAQLMVRLVLVAVAGPADALKVFGAVRIASLQSPDEPRRYDVVHVAPDACFSKVSAAGLHFAFSSQRGDAALPPFPPRRLRPRPLPVQVAPGHGPFLRAESRLAETATTLTVCAPAVAESLHHLGSRITALRTGHNSALLLLGQQPLLRKDSCGLRETAKGKP